MLPIPSQTALSGPFSRTETKVRAFNLMPGYRYVPFTGAGPLDQHRPTSASPVTSSAATTPSASGSGEDACLRLQIENCYYSQLSRKLVVFFRWRGAYAAEDLAQETLQRGWKRLSTGLELHAPRENYFFAIAYRVLHESWKTRLRDPQYVGLDLEPFGACVDEDDRDDHAARLKECLAVLSDEDRHVVMDYYAGDRDKLRGELGVDANALRVRVHRAIRKVRDWLASAEAGSPPGKPQTKVVSGESAADYSIRFAPAAGAVSTRRITEESTAMSYSNRNNGKQWSSQEKTQLRQMARENTPTRVIGFKLGRTPEAVYSQASKQGTSLGPTNQSPYSRRKG
jgi:DNA-directed RNA polymerase specialized sigma24 family protein